MLLVSVERNRYLQARPSQTHAEAVLPSQAPREGALRNLWKQFATHDEDGVEGEKRRERAGLATILRTQGPGDVRTFNLAVAQACGHKTTQAFQAAWDDLHPRSPEAVIVWFVLGDWRDRDTFLNWTGRAGGDFTRNVRRAMDPDAPVLTRAEIDALSSVNRQKDEARRAKAATALATETASQRLHRIDRYIERVREELGETAAQYIEREIRQERRVWEQRVERAEQRVARVKSKTEVSDVDPET